jgi:ABC-type molybdenum transport system ATPase subunit/photorepair protein PhrA
LQVAKRKIALLGFTGVGKTSLATRFVQGSFVDMYSPTITNTFHTSVTMGKKTLTTEILDTAGLVRTCCAIVSHAVGVDHSARWNVLKLTATAFFDVLYVYLVWLRLNHVQDGHTAISRHASVGIHGYLMLYR